MNPKLLALKLFLDELGVDRCIDTPDDRKRVQKAVFLGQIAGVDLGYRFGWYKRGPYSAELTRDYYAYGDLAAAREGNTEGKVLRKVLRDRLAAIRPLLSVPQDVRLEQEDWLELVASYHFLLAVSRLSKIKAHEVIRQEKPHLRDYVSQAERELTKYKLST